MNLNDLRMSLKSALDNMWARIDARITAIEQGGGGGVTDISHGGTGATTAAVTITNNYSSVLNAINAVKGTRIFPISIQKNQYGSYSDMPTGYETDEWNLLLVGDSIRLTANLYIYRGDQEPKMYLRHVYNGAWLRDWVRVV